MSEFMTITFIVLVLACVVFPTVLGIVAFCMMMRMSEDIRWLRFKDDPGSKKPMPYLKVIACCFIASFILAVLLASPLVDAMNKGSLNFPMQNAKPSMVSTSTR